MKKSLIVGSFLALVAIAGCNGSTTTGSAPVAVTTPSPTPSAVPTPQSQTVTTQSGSNASGSVTLTVGGLGVLFSYPGFTSSGAGNTAVTGAASASSLTTPPTVAFSSFKRATLSTRHALDSTNTPLFFMQITPATNLTFSGSFTAAFTIPSTLYPSGSNLYVAVYYPGATSWVDAAAGPGTVSGNSVTFTANTALTLLANQNYYLAVYYTSGTQTTATLPCSISGTTTGLNATAGTPLVSTGGISLASGGSLGYNINPSATGVLSVIPFSSSTLASSSCPTAPTGVTVYDGLAVNPSVNESLSAASLTYHAATGITPALSASTLQLYVLNATNPSAGWVNLTSLLNTPTISTNIATLTVPSANLSGASLLAGNQYLFILGAN